MSVNVNDCNGTPVEITSSSSVYVIGPISKYGKETGWNIASFEDVRDIIERNFGARATIPHDFIPEEIPYEAQMEASFDFLRSADAVVRLSDWADSNGATRESELCLSLGKPLIEEDDIRAAIYN